MKGGKAGSHIGVGMAYRCACSYEIARCSSCSVSRLVSRLAYKSMGSVVIRTMLFEALAAPCVGVGS